MTNSVTIETIAGKQCTVIWHDTKPRRFSGDWRVLNCGSIVLYSPTNRSHHIATALPALPSKPKPSDAPLLYRYMAEGLDLRGIEMRPDSGGWKDPRKIKGVRILLSKYPVKITHAIDSETGKRVNIATTESE